MGGIWCAFITFMCGTCIVQLIQNGSHHPHAIGIENLKSINHKPVQKKIQTISHLIIS
jgi:hypothetical protein